VFIAAEIIAMTLALGISGALLAVHGALHYMWPGITGEDPRLYIKGIIFTFMGILYAVMPAFFVHEFLLED
jgi:hypothetical protein